MRFSSSVCLSTSDFASIQSQASVNVLEDQLETNDMSSKFLAKLSLICWLTVHSMELVSKMKQFSTFCTVCARGKIVLNDRNPATGRGASSREKQILNTIKSVYDTLLNLLNQYDASGRVEIFRLLLERNCLIPLILPNNQHHLPLLGLVSKDIANNNNVCVGKDTQLMRVAVISCKDGKQSSTAELVRKILHVDSLHKQDMAIGSVSNRLTSAEIGLGVVEESQLKFPDNCPHDSPSEVDCNCPRKTEMHHMLVLHVVGDFRPLWSFIQAFKNYLIIEDAAESSACFDQRQEFNTKFDGTVLVWKATTNALQADWDVTSDINGFTYSLIQSPLNSELDKQITSDLVYVLRNHQRRVPEILMETKLPAPFYAILPHTLKSIDVKKCPTFRN